MSAAFGAGEAYVALAVGRSGGREGGRGLEPSPGMPGCGREGPGRGAGHLCGRARTWPGAWERCDPWVPCSLSRWPLPGPAPSALAQVVVGVAVITFLTSKSPHGSLEEAPLLVGVLPTEFREVK